MQLSFLFVINIYMGKQEMDGGNSLYEEPKRGLIRLTGRIAQVLVAQDHKAYRRGLEKLNTTQQVILLTEIPPITLLEANNKSKL